MASSLGTENRPLVLLFDIGGVCVCAYLSYSTQTQLTAFWQVVSPFQAILDYEKANGIPLGFINWTISQTNPDGAWQRLERGELLTNKQFFAEWKSDLENEKRWRTYYARYVKEQREKQGGVEPGVAAYDVPPLPNIDAEWLHLEMMRIARQLDPYMGPALKKLRQYADNSGGKLVLGALSNTSIFPPGHPLHDPSTTDGKASKGLDGIFDIFVSSAHVGMRKPADDIYIYAINRLHEFVKTRDIQSGGVKAKDIVFIDDIGTNLRTARNLGMRTIKVNLGRADLAVKELERITGLKLGDQAKL
jgi:FMN phosphatase YigB (HAD superfamily)